MMAKRTWQMMASVVGACLVGYFLYHTIQGDRGWLAMLPLQNELTAAKKNFSQMQEEHKELEHRVLLMRPGSMDPDLLDEKSREMLDFSKPNEIIVIDPPEKKDVV